MRILDTNYAVPVKVVRKLDPKQEMQFKKKKLEFLIRNYEKRIKALCTDQTYTKKYPPKLYKEVLKKTEEGMTQARRDLKEITEKLAKHK